MYEASLLSLCSVPSPKGIPMHLTCAGAPQKQQQPQTVVADGKATPAEADSLGASGTAVVPGQDCSSCHGGTSDSADASADAAVAASADAHRGGGGSGGIGEPGTEGRGGGSDTTPHPDPQPVAADAAPPTLQPPPVTQPQQQHQQKQLHQPGATAVLPGSRPHASGGGSGEGRSHCSGSGGGHRGGGGRRSGGGQGHQGNTRWQRRR
mmetsp:Transcript_89346/g.224685  ORF Transcript_89346/g.224685 Transcript_89346/m.224685 type:complete len:208 (+) Transcript_89346:2-625(+)